jgi:hypothetical protein
VLGFRVQVFDQFFTRTEWVDLNKRKKQDKKHKKSSGWGSLVATTTMQWLTVMVEIMMMTTESTLVMPNSQMKCLPAWGRETHLRGIFATRGNHQVPTLLWPTAGVREMCAVVVVVGVDS